MVLLTLGLQPLTRRLESHSTLSAAEREAVLALPVQQRSHRTCVQLSRAEEPAQCCFVMLKGYAAKYKALRNGNRQTVNVLMQGDLVGIETLFGRAQYEIETLTQCTVALIAASQLEALLSAHPTLTRTLWNDTLLDAAIQREWIVNLGRRDGTARTANLLCEMAHRHDQQGLAKREHFNVPLTQSQMADCVGLTPVHVNRVLRTLVHEQLVSNLRGRITITDWAGLARVGGFDPEYLAPASVVPVQHREIARTCSYGRMFACRRSGHWGTADSSSAAELVSPSERAPYPPASTRSVPAFE
jgi:CRP-like cAMP-binding protein